PRRRRQRVHRGARRKRRRGGAAVRPSQPVHTARNGRSGLRLHRAGAELVGRLPGLRGNTAPTGRRRAERALRRARRSPRRAPGAGDSGRRLHRPDAGERSRVRLPGGLRPLHDHADPDHDQSLTSAVATFGQRTATLSLTPPAMMNTRRLTSRAIALQLAALAVTFVVPRAGTAQLTQHIATAEEQANPLTLKARLTVRDTNLATALTALQIQSGASLVYSPTQLPH